MAAGYVAVSPTNYPVVYYVNPTVMAANAAAKKTLIPIHRRAGLRPDAGGDPSACRGGVCPAQRALTSPPMPYGSLVQWHQRTDVCGSSNATAVNVSSIAITGYPPCPSGSSVQSTPYVTMVWQVPVAGGPLAIQPPDIQIVEAATMQVSS